MEWYDQLLKENKTLADYHDLATSHVDHWVGYATSDFSTLPATPYIVSFAVTALLGLFLVWAFWRLISMPFRGSKSRKKTAVPTITLVKPDGYDGWPRTMQDTYLQGELFLATQAQQGADGAQEALSALNNKDHGPAIYFLGTVRDTAQMSGDQKTQLEMINFTAAFQFVDNITAAKQTIEHGLSINNQAPLTLLLNGDAALAQKNLKESFASYNQGLKCAKEQKHPKAEILALAMLGDIALRQKNMPQAEQYLTASLALSNTMMKQKNSNQSWMKMAIRSHLNIAKIQLLQQKYDESNQNYNLGLTLQQKLATSENHNVNFQRDIIQTHIQMGEAFTAQKDIEKGLLSFEKAQNLSQALLQKNPDMLIIKRDHALTLNKLGQVNLLANNKEVALQNFTASLALREQTAKENPTPQRLRDVAIGHERLGDYYNAEKDLPTAEQHFNQAYQLSKTTYEKAPNNLMHQDDLTRYLSRLSLIQAKSGKAEEAIKMMSTVIQLKESTVSKLPKHNGLKTGLAKSYTAMATLNKANGKAWLTKAHALLSPLSKTFTQEQKALMQVLEKQLATTTPPLASTA